MSESRRGNEGLSPWWRHGTILVMVGGFAVLSYMTVQTYRNAPPIPRRIVDETGNVVMAGEEIEKGQEVFLKYGLMEHGTLWGHGAYLGPDYSAEYLHRLAETTRDTLAQSRYGVPSAQLSAALRSEVGVETARTLKQNRYDPATETLEFSPGEVAAYRSQLVDWKKYFGGEDAAPGLPPRYIKNTDELNALGTYFAWAAWATVANRPGKDYSYTNN